MDILDRKEETGGGKSLHDVLTEGYQFDFGNYLGSGFSLFGKEAGSLIGFTLVYFVILVIGSAILGLIGIPFGDTIFSIVVGSALNAGIYTFMKARNTGSDFGFNSFFDGFKMPHWKELMLANLIQSILTIIIYVAVLMPFILNSGLDLVMRLTEIDQMNDPSTFNEIVYDLMNSGIIGYIFLGSLLSLVVLTLWCLAPLFIVCRNMGFWEAMEASRKVVGKKFFHFLGLMLVLAIILVIGAMLCGVGLLVAYPVFCLSIYAAFCHIMEEPHQF